jgi:hypothetical protein
MGARARFGYGHPVTRRPARSRPDSTPFPASRSACPSWRAGPPPPRTSTAGASSASRRSTGTPSSGRTRRPGPRPPGPQGWSAPPWSHVASPSRNLYWSSIRFCACAASRIASTSPRSVGVRSLPALSARSKISRDCASSARTDFGMWHHTFRVALMPTPTSSSGACRWDLARGAGSSSARSSRATCTCPFGSSTPVRSAGDSIAWRKGKACGGDPHRSGDSGLPKTTRGRTRSASFPLVLGSTCRATRAFGGAPVVSPTRR